MFINKIKILSSEDNENKISSPFIIIQILINFIIVFYNKYNQYKILRKNIKKIIYS